MMLLFYKLRLLNYILGSLKDIVVKLFLLTVYLYASSIMLIFLSNGFWYTVEFSSPKDAFFHLFQYCKWYYDNRESLGYEVSFRVLVGFLAPHFLYRLFLNTGWKSFLKEKIIQMLKFIIIGKRGNRVSHSSKPSASSYSYSRKNSYSSNSRYGCNDEHHSQDAKRKVNMIKQLLIKDIEEAIDRRLHGIFFSEKGKSH
ncbi:hypothetical protein [Wolbachia endosymbiont of Wuchereria bancrofti]|uniref:hypothetical protein n=1 Tax=Wolbachia endosymbiont of Wuchereria bancrofti TaxID=96496 RepID=UPI000B4CF5A7|nr:hypothetical protein [Wolbachia endosymbiont of Wuchereria bancrofti]